MYGSKSQQNKRNLQLYYLQLVIGDNKKAKKHRPQRKFDEIDPDLVSYYQALFSTYSELDFDRIAKEKICGNVYYYYKDAFEMTDEVIDKLSSFERFGEPKFLEMIDGELVVS